ncbi:ATP phosphoribosyltransferase regulatory subunit [Flavobacteriaceae bacterium]|nr:ATP phosphoribosyltransferase regulatory subunit [Flavobacteriaceae bacterium]
MTEEKLLPIGFYDLIGAEALSHQKITHELLMDFVSHDFQLIKPSLVEFGTKNDNEAFQAHDLESGESLIIRHDITLQIKRMLQGKLKNMPLPLKICYSGDVLNIKDNQLLYKNVDRQMTQVGLEVIGKDDDESLLQIVIKLLESLKNFLNVEDMVLEFSIANFFKKIAEDLNLKITEELLNAINSKNISFIAESNHANGKIIEALLLSKDITEVCNLINNLPIEVAKKNRILALEGVIKKITKIFGKSLQINVDIFNHQSNYHQDINLNILSKKSPIILARGGKYQLCKKIRAVGATVYINKLINL